MYSNKVLRDFLHKLSLRQCVRTSGPAIFAGNCVTSYAGGRGRHHGHEDDLWQKMTLNEQHPPIGRCAATLEINQEPAQGQA